MAATNAVATNARVKKRIIMSVQRRGEPPRPPDRPLPLVLWPPLEGLLGELGRVCDRLLPELEGLDPDDQELELREGEEDPPDCPALEEERDLERVARGVVCSGRLSSQEPSMVSAASDTVRQKTLGCAEPDVLLEVPASILLVSKRRPPVALLMDDEAQIGVRGATTIGNPPVDSPPPNHPDPW